MQRTTSQLEQKQLVDNKLAIVQFVHILLFSSHLLHEIVVEHLLLHIDEFGAMEHFLFVEALFLAQTAHLLVLPSLLGVHIGLYDRTLHQAEQLVVSLSSHLLSHRVCVVLFSIIEHSESDSLDEQDKRLLFACERVEQFEQHELVREREQFEQTLPVQPTEQQSAQHVEPIEQHEQIVQFVYVVQVLATLSQLQQVEHKRRRAQHTHSSHSRL